MTHLTCASQLSSVTYHGFLALIGQCGNQIGSAFWPLVLQEHGVQNSGDSFRREVSHPSRSLPSNLHSFFRYPVNSKSHAKSNSMLSDESAKSENIKARAVCIDMEDSVVARFRTGPLKHLFDDNCLLTSYPGSGNNWAEGFHTHGIRYMETIMNAIRKAVEHCDRLHGFLLLYSIGGGTGSGLGSATLGFLDDAYSEVDRFVTCVFPAANDDVITSAYNVALATRELSEHATCVFPVDNEALFQICDRQKKNSVSQIPSEYSFQNVNSIVVDMLLHLTSGSRFSGSLNMDMNDIQTNMVPFPKLIYLSSSLSPFNNLQQRTKNVSIDDLFLSSLSRENQLLKIDPLRGKILGASFVARGNVSLSAIQRNIAKLENRAQFAKWNYNGVKVGLCSVPPHGRQASILSLFNTSDISSLFQDTLKKFKKLYARKAHTHHYLQVDGFEEASFRRCQENLIETVADYTKWETYEPITQPRLNVL